MPSSAHPSASPQVAVEDPDVGWQPSSRPRPQSTVALNFMSELDDLFRLDGGIDLLDKTVHQKKQQVSSHAQELEALEAKLRETEERLNQARTSPPRRKDSQRRTPVKSGFSAQDKAHLASAGSPRQRQNMPDRPPTATDDGQQA